VSLPVAQFFARLGGLPCSWLIVVAQTFSRLPGSSLAWPAGGGGALLLGLLVVVLLAAGAGLSRLISKR
jgi:hypothetical protein